MKILVVDDDYIIRALVEEILEAFGYTDCLFAESGQDAIALVHEQTVPFDCFLVDIQMPNMTGIELTSYLRGTDQYTRTPILMITTMSERSYVDSAFAAGATDYITKPFDLNELQARLKLVDALVTERKGRGAAPGRETPAANAMMTPANLEKPLHIEDVDGVIDSLALENYILQMSRMSLIGNCVFGLVVRDANRLFSPVSHYEFIFAITDVAEAISDCLKPCKFMLTHLGSGSFACVRDAGRQFDVQDFTRRVNDRLSEMDLHYSDGKPISIHVAVGDPIQLDMKSGRGAVMAMLSAASQAERAAGPENIREPLQTTTGLKSLIGWK